jgi:NTP pyrophosphatase (non-canonical NTP hydrolase)
MENSIEKNGPASKYPPAGSKMSFDDYDREAAKTDKYGDQIAKMFRTETGRLPTGTIFGVCKVFILSIGLVGEAGEFCNKVKKIVRDGNGAISIAIREALLSELGDVLWYISRLCAYLGSSLEDVAKGNIEKLRGRDAAGTIQGSGDNR